MKFQMKIDNISDNRVILDWLESRYDLKSGETTVVELKDTLLFRKGQKADKAREKLSAQLDKGLVQIAVITDQMIQPVVSEEPVRASRPRKQKSDKPAESYEQELVNQKLNQSQETHDPTGRFRTLKSDSPEESDRLSPTPGTGRAEDEKVLDMTDKSLHEAHQEQEKRETRDSAVQQAQSQQDKQTKQASEKSDSEESTESSKSSKSTKSSSTKSKSTSGKKAAKSTSTKNTKSSTSTKSTESDESGKSEDDKSGGDE